MREVSLRRFRKISDISQQDVANGTGYTQAHISAVEKNKRSLTEDFLEKLNEVFQYKSKGFIIIEEDRDYSNNNNNIKNNLMENSSIINTHGSADEKLRLENEELKAEVIKLQKELIAYLKGSKGGSIRNK